LIIVGVPLRVAGFVLVVFGIHEVDLSDDDTCPFGPAFFMFSLL
jgi:hypothetical protein